MYPNLPGSQWNLAMIPNIKRVPYAGRGGTPSKRDVLDFFGPTVEAKNLIIGNF